MTSQNDHLPKQPEPCWRDNLPFPTFPALEKNTTTDVAIVGGGITGITAAYLLANKGLSVTLIDASDLLNGTTGHTTAKITSQHGLIYDQLIKDFGEEQAKLYYEANNDAMHFIRDTVKKHDIDCDLTTEDAYVYAGTDEYISKVQAEFTAYEKLGIPCEYTESIPFSIPCKAAVVMKNQSQFHPLKYLTALIPTLIDAGIKIYEHTTAAKVEDEGSKHVIHTTSGQTITCKYVLTASHYPFNDEIGLYFTRMHPERSYVLGIKTDEDYPGGMYLSAESPSRSLRDTTIDGEHLILVGGESHKTGQGIPTMEHYEALQAFSHQFFTVTDIPYRWSAQDLITVDKVPYIGAATKNHPTILISTGYGKWGMTNGTLAAKILTDRILEKENRYASLFDPSRFEAKSLKNLVTENANVAKELIKGKLSASPQSLEDLSIGEAAIIRVNGEKSGCYRDQTGQLHVVDSTCTHLGCEVAWNSGDTTWDCPCHGSRYSIDGTVLEGPAVNPLKKVDF